VALKVNAGSVITFQHFKVFSLTLFNLEIKQRVTLGFPLYMCRHGAAIEFRILEVTMKNIMSVVMLLGIAAGLPGCASSKPQGEAVAPSSLESRSDRVAGGEKSGRMLVWSANLSLVVSDVSASIDKAAAIAEQYRGYVEQKSDSGEASASMRMKIPAASFNDAVRAVQALGEVTHTRVAGEDVTERYIDVQARLKNKIELRERMRQLLQKATDIKDVITIESELSRIQTDIDTMEGTLKLLKGQVDYATIDVSLRRKKILGPLGLVFQGLWWGIEKLFVIRE
jgi:hypothetical protein